MSRPWTELRGHILWPPGHVLCTLDAMATGERTAQLPRVGAIDVELADGPLCAVMRVR